MSGRRDHLFINYASEDGAFAEWLTLKLTGEGHKVWCDRVKLFGGESYPVDIDVALRERTFRMLSVLSHHSIAKPQPLKERTLALNLARERHEELLIPLKLDGLRASELPWDLSDLTYISFDDGWAGGLAKLLKKLASIDAPHEFTAGRDSVRGYVRARSQLSGGPERLWTNLLPFRELPDTILRLEVGERPDDDVLARWPHFFDGPRRIWALDGPPDGDVDIVTVEPVAWRGVDRPSRGPRPVDVLTNLVREGLRRKAIERGLVESPSGEYLYFPRSLATADRLSFEKYDGSRTWVAAVGERHAWTGAGTEAFRYHLAVDFKPALDRFTSPLVHIRTRVFLTDLSGVPLSGTKLVRRRKLLCRDWWNQEWLGRLSATLQWLSGGGDEIVLTGSSRDRVVLAARPLTVDAPHGINESEVGVPDAVNETAPIDETNVPPWMVDEDSASDG